VSTASDSNSFVTANAGSYYVVITNVAGVATSQVATLTVLTAPVITQPLVNVTNSVGSNVSFTVAATGSQLSYQWMFTELGSANSVALTNTTATLTLANIQTNNSGTYTVTVTNAAGSASSSASLTVTPLGPPPPPLALRFPLNDTSAAGTTTASDTSTGGAAASLQMVTSSGVAANFHGTPGGGVPGLNVALDFSTNSDFSAGAGEGAAAGTGPMAATTNTALNFGAVSNFTAALWFNAVTNMPNTGGNNTLGPRLFTLGTNGVADKNITNSIGLYYQQWNQIAFTINTNQINANITNGIQNNYVPTNQWLFYAITYDGSNTATVYMGTAGSPAVALTNTSATAGQGPGGNLGLAPQLVNLGAPGSGSGATLQIGNRANGQTRPFDGWINDFRFYTGTGTSNFVEDIRWAALAPTNLAGVSNNAKINLSWAPLAGAASYNVLRSTTNGGPYTSIATKVLTASFTDSTIVPGTTYYYVVSAVNANGDGTTSANSTQASAGGVVPPSASTIQSVVLSGGTLTITAINGTPLGTFHLLSSPNVALRPLSSWTVVTSGSYSAAGTATIQAAFSPSNQQQFFLLVSP